MTRVGTTIAVACATFGALVLAERALAPDRDARGPAVERLIPAERLEGRTIAAFTLHADGSQLTYLRAKGLWRCREAFGAVCETDAVQAFLSSLGDTLGSLACAGDGCAERTGLLGPESVHVTLHGPQFFSDPLRDTIAELAFTVARGSSPGERGAAFGLLEGTQRVLAVDRDPRAHLDTQGRPVPLVDTRVLAGCFPPGFAGFERMFVDSGATSIEIASDPPPDANTERRWFLVDGANRRDALFWRVGGYVSLWVRLRWENVGDPREAKAVGLDEPLATITLAPNVGDPFEILVSRPDASNRVHLWNRATNVVAWVHADLLPLIVPPEESFTKLEGGNPWEAWLAPR